MKSLKPGLKAIIEIVVGETNTAAHLGSGLVPVFATPALVALMENAAVNALKGHLPKGQTTVGGRIEVAHTAATPVGMRVRAQAELVEVDGKKLTFKIQAQDEVEPIGEATHLRFIIEHESFLGRVQEKKDRD